MPQEISKVDVEEYTSKCKRNECKNKDCTVQRRITSAYCQECSDNYKTK